MTINFLENSYYWESTQQNEKKLLNNWHSYLKTIEQHGRHYVEAQVFAIQLFDNQKQAELPSFWPRSNRKYVEYMEKSHIKGTIPILIFQLWCAQ
jgi:hypothetical protein